MCGETDKRIIEMYGEKHAKGAWTLRENMESSVKEKRSLFKINRRLVGKRQYT
jgi:hypothetical protein